MRKERPDQQGRGFSNVELARLQKPRRPSQPEPGWCGQGRPARGSPVTTGSRGSGGRLPGSGACSGLGDTGRWAPRGGLAVGPESAEAPLEVKAEVRALRPLPARPFARAPSAAVLPVGGQDLPGAAGFGARPGGGLRGSGPGARGLLGVGGPDLGVRSARRPALPPSRPLAPRAGPARLASGPERRGRRGRAGPGRGGAEARRERSPSGAGGGGPRAAKMANVGLQFQASAGDADPQSRPLLLLGQLPHLHRVPWSHVRGKLQPRVTEEVSGPRRRPAPPAEAAGPGRGARRPPGPGDPRAQPPPPALPAGAAPGRPPGPGRRLDATSPRAPGLLEGAASSQAPWRSPLVPASRGTWLGPQRAFPAFEGTQPPTGLVGNRPLHCSAPRRARRQHTQRGAHSAPPARPRPARSPAGGV